MSARRPKPKKLHYKPWIEISVIAGDESQENSVIALLHLTPRDVLTLRDYTLAGAPCEHLAGFPNIQDQKEVDKLIAQMQLVATRLKVRLKIDRNEIADLFYPTQNDPPRS